MARGPRIRIIVIPPTGAEFDSRRLSRDLAKLVTDVANDGVRFVARYPPQSLTASGYRRTGTLARSWSAEPTKVSRREISAKVGSAGNIAPYNIFVQGEKPVAMFPRAGWRGVDDLDKFLDTRVRRGADRIMQQLTR
jgi:hypothetical protein